MSRAEALAQLFAGRPEEAASLAEAHLQLEPADAQGWFLLGSCRHALSDLAGAAQAFSRSIELDRANPDSHLALVAVLRAAGDASAALSAAQRALEHSAGDARLLYAAALTFEDLEQTDAALSHYDRALSVAPELEDALHNKGVLLARLGRFDEAEANQRRYIAAYPQATRAYSVLADVLVALGRFEEAMQALERAEGEDAGSLIRRGVVLACLRRFAEAKTTFDRAQARDPTEVANYLRRVVPGASSDMALSPENIYLWCQYLAQGTCRWTAWDAYIVEMQRAAAEPDIRVEPAIAFVALHLPLSAGERLAIARGIAGRIEARSPVLPPPSGRRRARIRIGLLSPDFREHLNAYLLLPLVQLLDRTRFEVYSYPLTASDGSAVRTDIDAAADKVIALHGMTDAQAAWRIRNDDIDILLDVAGHTTGGRFGITVRRPARLQMLYLGFAGSLGSACVDYAIVDATVQGGSEEWVEAPIRLPNTYYLYDFRAPPEDPGIRRQDYGLAEAAFVFCAFHKPEKITPDAFDLWMEVLSRVPDSVLWLLALPEAARDNLRAHAAGRSIDAGRLVFAPFEPRPRYLARQRLGDLMLDAIHHSAMTTACDALGGGLPVLTLRGSALASRAGESLLRAAGLPELVAASREEFVSRAVELASDAERLAELKSRLIAHRITAPLFDTVRRVAELEAAFAEAVRRFEARETPASFDVSTRA